MKNEPAKTKINIMRETFNGYPEVKAARKKIAVQKEHYTPIGAAPFIHQMRNELRPLASVLLEDNNISATHRRTDKLLSWAGIES